MKTSTHLLAAFTILLPFNALAETGHEEELNAQQGHTSDSEEGGTAAARDQRYYKCDSQGKLQGESPVKPEPVTIASYLVLPGKGRSWAAARGRDIDSGRAVCRQLVTGPDGEVMGQYLATPESSFGCGNPKSMQAEEREPSYKVTVPGAFLPSIGRDRAAVRYVAIEPPPQLGGDRLPAWIPTPCVLQTEDTVFQVLHPGGATGFEGFRYDDKLGWKRIEPTAATTIAVNGLVSLASGTVKTCLKKIQTKLAATEPARRTATIENTGADPEKPKEYFEE